MRPPPTAPERCSDFSPSELLRYARHLSLPEVGLRGQTALKHSKILLVGAGGLGSPAALYLTAAGVGTLGIIDADRVDIPNLHRQVLHGGSAVGELKTRSAERRLRDLNPEVAVERIEDRLTTHNALELVARYDVLIDGSDNFPTRYLVNDACVLTGRPYVYGSISRFDGQVSLFAAPGGPCYRCLYATPPPADLIPSCAEAGVLGVLPGIIGSLQALEAIKWVLGIGSPLVGRLVLFDALRLSFRELRVRPDPNCMVCGGTPSVTALVDYERFCGVSLAGEEVGQISAMELEAQLADARRPLVLDVRDPWEVEIASIPESVHIPLSLLWDRLSEIEPRRAVVTLCHTGPRAASARAVLLAAGFSEVRSLTGGIEAWALAVDRKMRRY